jgi:predicted nucleic acid-binding protein
MGDMRNATLAEWQEYCRSVAVVAETLRKCASEAAQREGAEFVMDGRTTDIRSDAVMMALNFAALETLRQKLMRITQ